MWIMKAYLTNMPPIVLALIAIPVLIVTRCAWATVVPQVVHAVVPGIVRTVLHAI